MARSNNFALAPNLQNNLSDIRLGFRWPILAETTRTGIGSQVFRTSVSGKMTNFVATSVIAANIPLFFFQPQSFGASTTTPILP